MDRPELDKMEERVRTQGFQFLTAEQASNLHRDLASLCRYARELEARLDSNRCNSGHETLPLIAWDCPECVRIERERLEARIKELEALAKEAAAEFLSLGTFDNSGSDSERYFEMAGRFGTAAEERKE